MNKQVVGMAFINDGKLLVCMSMRSSKQGKYTLIGGGVEQNETLEEAIIREVKEELNLDINENDFYKALSFTDQAASDPNLTIDMTIFIYNKKFNGELATNDEIIAFKWYDIDQELFNISSAIANHLLPWAIDKNLMY